jgi:hypothetical protein
MINAAKVEIYNKQIEQLQAELQAAEVKIAQKDAALRIIVDDQHMGENRYVFLTAKQALSNTKESSAKFLAWVKAEGVKEFLVSQMNRDYSDFNNQEFAEGLPEFYQRLHAEFCDKLRGGVK